MGYQPISDPAQLQLLEHLLRLVLHGILLSIGVASVCLPALCVSELRPPQRRPSVVKGHERRTTGHGMPKVVQAELSRFVIQHWPPMGDLAPSVIPLSLQLKDLTLAGLAMVHANLLVTTRHGGQIIRYVIRGG
jgi:hypothetical protein